jgi:DNA polymerase-3 subunit gamma/tau
VQLYYDIAVAGRRDLDWAPDPKSGLEMACLRMLAFRPAGRDAAKPATPAPVRKKEPAPPSEVREEPAAERTVVSRVNDDASTDDWHALVERLPLKAMAAQLARNCVCREIGGGRVLLELPASLEHLLTDNARKQMESALAAELGDERRIEIRLGDGKGDSPARRDEAAADARRRAAREAIESDPNVRELQERLGARIREDSIEPEGE